MTGPGSERVMVFIDGQNLYKGVKKLHRTRVHPILIARELVGDRTLTEARYYSGVHQPRENPELHALAMRRHELIRRTGLTVIERTLRYHWDWKVVDRLPSASRAPEDETRKVKVKRSRVAREKGIDLALGIDAVTAALTDRCDTVIIVSRDRDLGEVGRDLRERTGSNRARVEVASVVGEYRHLIDGYDHTHFIDAEMSQRCRDDFDYFKKLPKAEVKQFLASLD